MQTILAACAIALVVAICLLRRVPREARVVDGDTIVVGGRKWRLTGYDSPEWDQPGGRDASAHLKSIIAAGGCIAVMRGWDPYGRRKATVLTTRGPLSWRMVWAGQAHADTLVGHLLSIVPRIAGRGLWGMPTRAIHPAFWRQTQPGYSKQLRVPRTNGGRRGRLDFRYSRRDGLKLPGGFHIP